MENLNLETLRIDVAESNLRAYGAERAYAIALNEVFGEFDWFEVSHYDKSEPAKPVHEEKTALFEVLKKVNHSNPSVVWGRIRKYGKAEKYGEPDSEADTDGEAGTANHNRPPMLRNVEDLTDLYKFNARQTELPEKVKDAQVFIVKALEALGVDVNMVATK